MSSSSSSSLSNAESDAPPKLWCVIDVQEQCQVPQNGPPEDGVLVICVSPCGSKRACIRVTNIPHEVYVEWGGCADALDRAPPPPNMKPEEWVRALEQRLRRDVLDVRSNSAKCQRTMCGVKGAGGCGKCSYVDPLASADVDVHTAEEVLPVTEEEIRRGEERRLAMFGPAEDSDDEEGGDNDFPRGNGGDDGIDNDFLRAGDQNRWRGSNGGGGAGGAAAAAAAAATPAPLVESSNSALPGSATLPFSTGFASRAMCAQYVPRVSRFIANHELCGRRGSSCYEENLRPFLRIGLGHAFLAQNVKNFAKQFSLGTYNVVPKTVPSFMARSRLHGYAWVELKRGTPSYSSNAWNGNVLSMEIRYDELCSVPEKRAPSQLPPVRVLVFDIETISKVYRDSEVLAAMHPIAVICVKVIGGPPKSDGSPFVERRCLAYNPTLHTAGGTLEEDQRRERIMLSQFFMLIRTTDPDMILGYNSNGFDVPYVMRRARKLGMKVYRNWSRIAPMPVLLTASDGYGRPGAMETYVISCPGRVIVDLLPIARMDKSLDSYTLDIVAKEFKLKSRKSKDVGYKELHDTFYGLNGKGREHHNEKTDVEGPAAKVGNDDSLYVCCATNKPLLPGPRRVARYCMIDVEVTDELKDAIKIVSRIQARCSVQRVCPQEALDRGLGFRISSLLAPEREDNKLVRLAVDAPRRRKKKLVTDEERAEARAQVAMMDPHYAEIPGYRQLYLGSLLGEKYSGGFVFDVQRRFLISRGMFNVDFNSLYPSIIRTHNICHCTILTRKQLLARGVSRELLDRIDKEPIGSLTEELPKNLPGVHVSPAGFFFVEHSVREGILPLVSGKLVAARKSVRLKQESVEDKESPEFQLLEALQLEFKVTANSVYGILGTMFGQESFFAGAASVTQWGAYIIQNLAKALETHPKWEGQMVVVYGDTDSLFIVPKHLIPPGQVPLRKSEQTSSSSSSSSTTKRQRMEDAVPAEAVAEGDGLFNWGVRNPASMDGTVEEEEVATAGAGAGANGDDDEVSPRVYRERVFTDIQEFVHFSRKFGKEVETWINDPKNKLAFGQLKIEMEKMAYPVNLVTPKRYALGSWVVDVHATEKARSEWKTQHPDCDESALENIVRYKCELKTRGLLTRNPPPYTRMFMKGFLEEAILRRASRKDLYMYAYKHVRALYTGQVNRDSLVRTATLSKPIKDYMALASPPPHVIAAQQMVIAGMSVRVGNRVPYLWCEMSGPYHAASSEKVSHYVVAEPLASGYALKLNSYAQELLTKLEKIGGDCILGRRLLSFLSTYSGPRTFEKIGLPPSVTTMVVYSESAANASLLTQANGSGSSLSSNGDAAATDAMLDQVSMLIDEDLRVLGMEEGDLGLEGRCAIRAAKSSTSSNRGRKGKRSAQDRYGGLLVGACATQRDIRSFAFASVKKNQEPQEHHGVTHNDVRRLNSGGGDDGNRGEQASTLSRNVDVQDGDGEPRHQATTAAAAAAAAASSSSQRDHHHHHHHKGDSLRDALKRNKAALSKAAQAFREGKMVV